MESIRNLKDFYDRVLEYVPLNEASENEAETRPRDQQPQQRNQIERQKSQTVQQLKIQTKPSGSKIRPGFEGPRVVRTKRQK